MAELVDALVSNTNEAIRAGSIPARGTAQTIKSSVNKVFTDDFSFLGSQQTFTAFLSYPSGSMHRTPRVHLIGPEGYGFSCCNGVSCRWAIFRLLLGGLL